jgi:hypothetical protein
VTVEQLNVIDFVGTDTNGNVVLTISDHLPWDKINEHLFFLQEKLNACLRFVESGEIYEKFPERSGLPILISVVLKFRIPDDAKWVFAKSSLVIQRAGFQFEIRYFSS